MWSLFPFQFHIKIQGQFSYQYYPTKSVLISRRIIFAIIATCIYFINYHPTVRFTIL